MVSAGMTTGAGLLIDADRLIGGAEDPATDGLASDTGFDSRPPARSTH